MTSHPRAEEPSITRSRLWTRSFVLFFVARGVAKMGDGMLPIALAAGLIQYGHGAGGVGLAMASFTACFAGFVIFGGVIADRLDTRALMIASDLVRVVTQSLVAAMFATGYVVLWQVCVIGAVNGLCAALFQPGVASTIPKIADDVQGANGAIRVAESAMTIAGPALAGVLIGVTSAAGVFAAHALTYLVSAVCLALLTLPPGVQREGRTAFMADLVDGWREFAARRWLWGVIAIWMFFMVTAFGPTTPLSATDVVTRHGADAYAVVNSAFGVGMVAGGVLAMRMRPLHPLRAGSVSLFGYLVQPLSVGLQAPVPTIAAGFAVSGAAMAFWSVMWATSIQTQVPPDVLNRIHAYEVAGSLAMMPVGQALAGPAAQVLGTHQMLITSAVLTVLCASTMLTVPAIRDMRRVDLRP
jgi:MFS family permease